MYDYFTEHIVNRKKTAADRAATAGIIVLGVLISAFIILSGALFLQLIGQIILILAAAMWWGITILVSSKNIEYEYTVTNGEIDIDKIMGKRKRKRLVTVSSKAIELIQLSKDYRGNFDATLDAASHSGAEDEYVLITMKDGKRTKILFNPSEKMLKIFKRFRPQNVEWNETL